jgi:hypothetical protein
MVGQFGIADVERLCPGVSRDTIRLGMNRWREQGRLEMLGKGRDAKWARKAKKWEYHINVGINIGIKGSELPDRFFILYLVKAAIRINQWPLGNT